MVSHPKTKVKETEALKKTKVRRDNHVLKKTMPDKKKSSQDVVTRKKVWKRKAPPVRGVAYLSHIPHGFYEEEMKAYFSQFGNVTGVYLPRSKTGKSKGYAFIQFQHEEVAKIAAEAMDRYLMFNRVIHAKYLPPEQQKPFVLNFFASNSKTLESKTEENIENNRNQKNSTLVVEEECTKAQKMLKKHENIRKRMESNGIDCDFEIEMGNIHTVLERGEKAIQNKKLKTKKITARKTLNSKKKGTSETSEAVKEKQQIPVELSTPSRVKTNNKTQVEKTKNNLEERLSKSNTQVSSRKTRTKVAIAKTNNQVKINNKGNAGIKMIQKKIKGIKIIKKKTLGNITKIRIPKNKFNIELPENAKLKVPGKTKVKVELKGDKGSQVISALHVDPSSLKRKKPTKIGLRQIFNKKIKTHVEGDKDTIRDLKLKKVGLVRQRHTNINAKQNNGEQKPSTSMNSNTKKEIQLIPKVNKLRHRHRNSILKLH